MKKQIWPQTLWAVVIHIPMDDYECNMGQRKSGAAHIYFNRAKALDAADKLGEFLKEGYSTEVIPVGIKQS